MDMLGDLLRIKKFREDKAERELLQAGQALTQARQALARVRQACEDYRMESDRRERALYADLCSRLVSLRDLDDLALEVDRMRGERAQHEDRVAGAVSEEDEASNRAEDARLGYRHAMRMCQKFTELDLLAKEEQILALQHLEDSEMEEVRTIERDPEEMKDEAALEQGLLT